MKGKIDGVLVENLFHKKEKHNIRKGDVITSVGLVDVKNIDALKTNWASAKQERKRSVLVRLNRNGNFLFSALPTDARIIKKY